MAQAYPLSWPAGWKRTKDRKVAAFKNIDKTWRSPGVPGGSGYYSKTVKWLTVADGVARVLGELSRMGINRDDVIISTNVPTRLDGLPRSNEREPSDPGAAVYWRPAPGAQTRCMAIDRYTTVADNLAAIAATLDAMRAIERHGGAQILERAFLGFAALPEKGSRHWREVLGVTATGTEALDQAKSKYRGLALLHHPDRGGDRDKFEEVTTAWRQAQEELNIHA